MGEELHGKVAVITGGAGGIGAALARRLAQAGARVAVMDVAGYSLARSVDDLQAAGFNVLGLQCDVTSEMECQRAVARVVDRYGGVDILCNNAGITQISAFLDTQTDVYRRVMDINFFGALHMTRAAIASLMERRGLIVVISSVAGFAPLLGRTGYSASKHALHGFFETLRVEVHSKGVRVLMVCPGFTRTALQSLAGDGSTRQRPRKLNGKEASPVGVADAVCRAIIRRRRTVVLTARGKLAWVVSRLCPSLYDRFMVRQVAGELASDP